MASFAVHKRLDAHLEFVVLFQNCMRTQLAANPRVVPRNFQMHAVIRSVEEAVSRGSTVQAGSFHRIEAVEAYLDAVSKPFTTMSPHQYAEYALTATVRQQRARSETWNWSRDSEAVTEPLSLYPHLSRPGVTFCSCSS